MTICVKLLFYFCAIEVIFAAKTTHQKETGGTVHPDVNTQKNYLVAQLKTFRDEVAVVGIKNNMPWHNSQPEATLLLLKINGYYTFSF